MNLKCRWILCVVVGCLFASGLLAAEGFDLSVTSDRDDYIEGMPVTFAVTLTHPTGKRVNLNNKELVATFPDENTEVSLTPVTPEDDGNPTEWTADVVPTGSGDQTFRVALMNKTGQGDPQGTGTEKPFAEAEKTVYVYPMPTVSITAPSAGSFLRQIVDVTVQVTGELGGELTVSVDMNPFAVKTITVGAETVQLDTTGLADGSHTLLAWFVPETFTQQYASDPLNVITDNTAPVLVEFSPADGAEVDDPTVPLSVSYMDATSGIDVGTVRLLVNDQDVTAEAQVSGTSLAYLPEGGWAGGDYSWRVELSDLAGNGAVFQSSFSVILLQIELDLKAIVVVDGETQYRALTDDYWCTSKTLRVRVDVTGGVPPLTVHVNGVLAEEVASYEATISLGEGVNTILVEVEDSLGNTASAETEVAADSIPPTISLDYILGQEWDGNNQDKHGPIPEELGFYFMSGEAVEPDDRGKDALGNRFGLIATLSDGEEGSGVARLIILKGNDIDEAVNEDEDPIDLQFPFYKYYEEVPYSDVLGAYTHVDDLPADAILKQEAAGEGEKVLAPEVELPDQEEGKLYSLTVVAADNAGNVGESRQVFFVKKDTTKPILLSVDSRVVPYGYPVEVKLSFTAEASPARDVVHVYGDFGDGEKSEGLRRYPGSYTWLFPYDTTMSNYEGGEFDLEIWDYAGNKFDKDDPEKGELATVDPVGEFSAEFELHAEFVESTAYYEGNESYYRLMDLPGGPIVMLSDPEWMGQAAGTFVFSPLFLMMPPDDYHGPYDDHSTSTVLNNSCGSAAVKAFFQEDPGGPELKWYLPDGSKAGPGPTQCFNEDAAVFTIYARHANPVSNLLADGETVLNVSPFVDPAEHRLHFEMSVANLGSSIWNSEQTISFPAVGDRVTEVVPPDEAMPGDSTACIDAEGRLVMDVKAEDFPELPAGLYPFDFFVYNSAGYGMGFDGVPLDLDRFLPLFECYPSAVLAGEVQKVRIRGWFKKDWDGTTIEFDAANFTFSGDAGDGVMVIEEHEDFPEVTKPRLVWDDPFNTTCVQAIEMWVQVQEESPLGLCDVTISDSQDKIDAFDTITLKDALNVIKMDLVTIEGQEMEEIPLLDASILEQWVARDRVSASFGIDGAALADPFMARLTFTESLDDGVDVRLEATTNETIVEAHVAETDELGIFESEDGTVRVDLSGLPTEFDPDLTGQVEVGIRASAFGSFNVFTKTLFNIGGGAKVFKSVRVTAKVEVNPAEPDMPFRDDVADQVHLTVYRDGTQLFADTLTEDGVDSNNFMLASMALSVTRVTSLSSEEVDDMTVIVTDVTLDLIKEPVDLVETTTASLVFSSEEVVTPSLSDLDDHIFYPNPPIDPQKFYYLRVVDITGTLTGSAVIQHVNEEGDVLEAVQIELEGEPLRSKKPIIPYAGALSPETHGYLSENYYLVDPDGIERGDGLRTYYKMPKPGKEGEYYFKIKKKIDALWLHKKYEDGTRTTWRTWDFYMGQGPQIEHLSLVSQKNLPLVVTTIDAAGKDTNKNKAGQKIADVQITSAGDIRTITAIPLAGGIARVYLKYVYEGKEYILTSIAINVVADPVAEDTLARRTNGHHPHNPWGYDLTTIGGCVDWVNKVTGLAIKKNKVKMITDPKLQRSLDTRTGSLVIEIVNFDLNQLNDQREVLSGLMHEGFSIEVCKTNGIDPPYESNLIKGHRTGAHDYAVLMEMKYQNKTGLPLNTFTVCVNAGMSRFLNWSHFTKLFNAYKQGHQVKDNVVISKRGVWRNTLTKVPVLIHEVQ